MRENIAVCDFTLNDEEMQQIAALDRKTSLFFDHSAPEAVKTFVGFNEMLKAKMR